jgi:hypothetical protein
LDEAATCKEYLQVRREGARDVRRSLKHYSLDAILAVGYRVRSARGTAFRQWATARLSELLVKAYHSFPFLRQWPRWDALVDLLHQSPRLLQRDNDLLIVFDVLVAEFSSLAVL